MQDTAHMQIEELGHAINKGLEFWSLQTLTDGAIMLSFVILAMVAGRCYLESVRRRLTLRVAAEVWEAGTDVLIDASMGFVALVGLFITNPDIMADIKIGLPWVPLAMVLMAVALVIRAFHGGRVVGSAAWWIVLGLVAAACAANWFGFTFVMEAAGEEYLKKQPDSCVAYSPTDALGLQSRPGDGYVPMGQSRAGARIRLGCGRRRGALLARGSTARRPVPDA